MAAMQSATDLFLICTELENTAPKRVIQSARHKLTKTTLFQRHVHCLYCYRHLLSGFFHNPMPSIADCFLFHILQSTSLFTRVANWLY